MRVGWQRDRLWKRTTSKRWKAIICYILAFVGFSVFLARTCNTALLPPDFDSKKVVGFSCDNKPKLLILVLTASRSYSLSRLLKSLSAADYGCAVVDLQINIDIAASFNLTTLAASKRCADVAANHAWVHGRKTVFRRFAHAGLSRSWFESPHAFGYDYISILEDDMQVSRHFFTVFSFLHVRGAFENSAVTAFCLHPNDWEVKTDPPCDATGYSQHLYLSPEPCNWGPIWKYSEWTQYIDWVFTMKARRQSPYVPENIAYEFNEYLHVGKDVQSSWVWRYNYDYGKRQVRYSFVKCHGGGGEVFLAINHKEPGEHFKKKMDLHNDPKLLEFSVRKVFKDIVVNRGDSIVPMPFTGYHYGAKSLRG
mmetsp:Transcript_11997/g.46550  ORF Transcript_11997/g.46550 Transcript_11997/m.46550 type:complete len:366 (-) Transcript_11997:573-1670(-)